MKTIALVSPASPVDPELLAKGRRIMEERFGPVRLIGTGNLLDSAGYLAGDDEARLRGWEEAFALDADMVWFSRGGFGTTRILERIDWARYAGSDRPIAGYSDATPFLLAYAAAGGRAFHAPMIAADVTRENPRSMESLGRTIFGAGVDKFEFEGEWLVGRGMEGPILAGNLTLVAALAGTRHFPDGAGRVICLEDVKEEPYRIDRALTQLVNAGLFRGAAGVVFGSMHECVAEKPEKSFTVEEVLRRFAVALGLPAVMRFPFGHGGENTVMPEGGSLRIDAGEGALRAEVRRAF